MAQRIRLKAKATVGNIAVLTAAQPNQARSFPEVSEATATVPKTAKSLRP